MLDGNQNVVTDNAQTGRLSYLLLQVSPSVYSASLAQQRLWFLHQLQGRSTAYNVHLGLWLRGPLNLNALQSAFREMVNRHDSLRTAFRLESGNLQQVVSENCDPEIDLTDLTSVADPTAEAYLLARRAVEEPLNRRPTRVFLCGMDHIITDAWSLQIFAKEFAQLYSAFSQGQAPSLPPLPIRYGDFAEWQLEWCRTDRVQRQLAYCKKKLEER